MGGSKVREGCVFFLKFGGVGSFPAFVIASPASVIGSLVTWHNSLAVTISRLNRLLITLDRHVRTHTWDNIAQKYSMEKMNIFFLYPESISDTLASKSNKFSTELCHLQVKEEQRGLFLKEIIKKSKDVEKKRN